MMWKWNFVYKFCDLFFSYVKVDKSFCCVGWQVIGGVLVGDVGERLLGIVDFVFICYLFDGVWF